MSSNTRGRSMQIRSIKEIKNLKGKRILLRVDFNVPLEKGKVKDDFKIQKTLPTIKFLIKKGAKVILASHLGRPKGFDEKLSLEPVVKHLAKLLKEPVKFLKIKRLEDYKKAQLAIEQLSNGKVTMLENVRFLNGEESNDPAVSKALASLADIFVLDGFAVAHRDAASVSGVAKLLPSYAGLLLFEEVSVLDKVMRMPKRPLVVMLGGAKVETKIPIIRHLLQRADYILVGGEIANTYWWAKGQNVGGSLVGKEFKKEVLKYCKNKKVILPVDVVAGKLNGQQSQTITVKDGLRLPARHADASQAGGRDTGYGIYDIGPATVKLFANYIAKAKTILWNGALGVFEVSPYHKGTFALARQMVKNGAYTVMGGGETVEILKKCGIMNRVDLVSTGGGAMLEFLGGKKLPGIEALKNK